MPNDMIAIDDLEFAGTLNLDAAIREAERVQTLADPARLARLKAAHVRQQAREEAEAQERLDLPARWERWGNDRRSQFLTQQLRELEQTPPTEAGALVEAAITTAKQWFAVGSSFAGAQGKRFPHRWDGSTLIESASPRAWRSYWARIGARPVPLTREQQPWLADLARLRELLAKVPPRPGAIGNGG
jgi:hypothetical protein